MRTLIALAARRAFSASVMLVAAALAISFGAASAHAQAKAQPPDTIWACYIPRTGTVYRIKTTDLRQTCRSSKHVMFSWNAQGPQGDTGPQGPAGPAGSLVTPSGTPLLLLTGIYQVSQPLSLPAVGSATGVATCSAGDRVVGGGAFVSTIQANKVDISTIATVFSGPYTSGVIVQGQPPTQGWSVMMKNPNASVSARVTAICAAIGH